ncbi:FAD-dependent oxidoreductase [Nocardioides sp. NPDC101246]|uniref:FAD-dependent oxidoreductase n=1 Tax=Nocardioides sp. NPDC101246 TaxID=3364336 RepID=UPI00380D3F41
MHPDERVTIIGAGVTGLTTAVVLAEAGHSVRVVADEIPGGTSLAAGAMWGPYLVEPKAMVDAWSQRSLEVFCDLASDAATGVRVSSGIEATRHYEAAPAWARALPGFEPVGADKLPDGFRSGYRFSVPLIDMPTYLRYLLERAGTAGVVVDDQHVSTLTSLTDADVIVNCSGMGAAVLADDTDLRPIRGQHVIVANPGLTEFFSEDTGMSSDLLCIYPQGEVIVLGGTAIDGSSDTTSDPVAADRILQRCIAVEPRLASAPVIEHRIGLRPTRSQVRVEAEQMTGTMVIHNYGHGGAGVTLSWGCAEQVQQLLGSSASG